MGHTYYCASDEKPQLLLISLTIREVIIKYHGKIMYRKYSGTKRKKYHFCVKESGKASKGNSANRKRQWSRHLRH